MSNLLVTGEYFNISEPKKDGDVGYDLAISEQKYLSVGQLVYLHTGVRVKLPRGYWGRLCGRSSTFRKGLWCVEGVIDNGYTGELIVGILNASGIPRKVSVGDRLAQLILHQICTPPTEYRTSLPATERGSDGFGSTG